MVQCSIWIETPAKAQSVAGRFERLEHRTMLSATPYLVDATTPTFTNSIPVVQSKVGEVLAAFAASEVPSTSPSNGDIIDITNSLFDVRDGYVGITAAANGNVVALEAALAKLGMMNPVVNGSSIAGLLPTSSISSLNAIDSLFVATPNVKPISSIGLANLQGDRAQRTELSRTFQGLTGAGVTVGVISDSFDQAAGSAATDISTGDLPGVGNPNGNLQPINVYRDNAVRPVTNSLFDEGRAMLQIVHDAAPGAKLAFSNAADAFGTESELAMAANIQALRTSANANIIVDDLLFLTEPMFMDGFIAQAVDSVVNNGVIYVSAAGNHANDSFAGGFQNGGQVSLNLNGGAQWSGTIHNFTLAVATLHKGLPYRLDPLQLPCNGTNHSGL